MSKVFYYYITPIGVLSFNKKYLCINGKVTKDSVKLRKILQSFDSELFSNDNMYLLGIFSYEQMFRILFRICRCGLNGVRIIRVSDLRVHKASEIFHGQYSIYVYNTINDSCFHRF